MKSLKKSKTRTYQTKNEHDDREYQRERRRIEREREERKRREANHKKRLYREGRFDYNDVYDLEDYGDR
jgi:hypothetical protein